MFETMDEYERSEECVPRQRCLTVPASTRKRRDGGLLTWIQYLFSECAARTRENMFLI